MPLLAGSKKAKRTLVHHWYLFDSSPPLARFCGSGTSSLWPFSAPGADKTPTSCRTSLLCPVRTESNNRVVSLMANSPAAKKNVSQKLSPFFFLSLANVLKSQKYLFQGLQLYPENVIIWRQYVLIFKHLQFEHKPSSVNNESLAK